MCSSDLLRKGEERLGFVRTVPAAQVGRSRQKPLWTIAHNQGFETVPGRRKINGMPPIEISCPNCGRKLKIPDRSVLGRKGRCSKCQHGFIMRAPEEEPTVLFAEAPVPPPSAAPGDWHGAERYGWAAALFLTLVLVARLVAKVPQAAYLRQGARGSAIAEIGRAHV